jgi:hypothetical protein
MKYNIIFYTFFLFLISGCGRNTCEITQELLEKNKLDDNYCPIIDSTIKSLPNSSIKVINIFIDASGSMTGFMPTSRPSTEFQILIPDIISKLETEFNGQINIYPIYNSNSPMKKSSSISDVQKGIIYGNLAQDAGDTYIPTMLDSICKGYFSPNSINIFISDCIYSPRNAEKKQAEQATREIRQAIVNYTKDYYTSIFCLFSQFNKISNSPYYLIVFGKPENNHHIENIIENSISTKKQNYQQTNFGLLYDKPFYSVLPYTNISANCIANPCTNLKDAYANVEVENFKAENDSVSFWIALNLKKLPNYAKTKNYLENNLDLSIQKGVADIVEITTSVPNDIHKDDKEIANSSTYFVRVKVSSIEECATVIDLRLKYSTPSWISKLNQIESESNGEKTFGLERLMNGFSEAYKQDNQALFFKNLTISIIKK